ncbi:hypothetical protein TNCV_885111 [Trichonephila clavipes]|nr:hypothetical protein TNCV_885111 [Trichonephila clavipes]
MNTRSVEQLMHSKSVENQRLLVVVVWRFGRASLGLPLYDKDLAKAIPSGASAFGWKMGNWPSLPTVRLDLRNHAQYKGQIVLFSPHTFEGSTANFPKKFPFAEIQHKNIFIANLGRR